MRRVSLVEKINEVRRLRPFQRLAPCFATVLVKLAKKEVLTLKYRASRRCLSHDKDDDSLLLHQEWIAECVKRGLWLTNHHNHFINLAMTEETVKESLAIAAEAMDV